MQGIINNLDESLGEVANYIESAEEISEEEWEKIDNKITLVYNHIIDLRRLVNYM